MLGLGGTVDKTSDRGDRDPPVSTTCDDRLPTGRGQVVFGGDRARAFPWGRCAPDAVGLRCTHGMFAALCDHRAVTADAFGPFLIRTAMTPRRILGKEHFGREIEASAASLPHPLLDDGPRRVDLH